MRTHTIHSPSTVWSPHISWGETKKKRKKNATCILFSFCLLPFRGNSFASLMAWLSQGDLWTLSLNTLLKNIPPPKKRSGPMTVGPRNILLKNEKKTDGVWLWYRQTIDGVNMYALNQFMTYADVCWRMLTYADVSCRQWTASTRTRSTNLWRTLTYADVCWRMLTYAAAVACGDARYTPPAFFFSFFGRGTLKICKCVSTSKASTSVPVEQVL